LERWRVRWIVSQMFRNTVQVLWNDCDLELEFATNQRKNSC